MAVVASVSSPTSGVDAVSAIITALVTSAWVVKGYGTGSSGTGSGAVNLSYNTSTNPFATGQVAAGTLSNPQAWARIASPDASREWLFQRTSAAAGSANDHLWLINRSKAGFSTGGTASVAPTASDSTPLFGTTAPTWSQAFPTTTWRMFVSVENAAPYGFTVFGITLGGGNVLSILADEPLLTGTSATEDTDPYLWIGYYNAPGLAAPGAFSLGNTTTMVGYKRFVPASSNQRINYGYIYDGAASAPVTPPQNTSTGQMGPTPSGVLEVPIRIPVFRNAASSTSSGWCGFTGRHRWSTVGGRTNGQTLANGTSAYWIYAAGVWVPWDSTTPALS